MIVSMRRGAALAGLLAALVTTMAAANVGSTNWTKAFGPIGCDHYVSEMMVWNNQLVAAGYFTLAGTAAVYGVAIWDGSDWCPLGSDIGLVGIDGIGTVLAEFNGDLIVGGIFTNAGGVLCNNIARWDGTSWHALGTGTNSEVKSLAVLNGSLYVGGTFTTAGGVNRDYIARWSGTGWFSLGSGMGPIGGPYGVAALTTFNGSLIAGGRFTTAGGVAVSNIARWDGAWHAMGAGLDSNCYALTNYGGAVIVGGGFAMAGGIPASRVARWNGVSWSTLGTGLDSIVSSFGTYGGNLVVVGHFQNAGATSTPYFAFWNGASWSGVAGGPLTSCMCAQEWLGDLYLGGTFDEIGSGPIGFITRYDGTSFSGLYTPPAAGLGGTCTAITTYDGQTIAAGDFSEVEGGLPLRRIGAWDGAQWTPLGNGLDGDPKDLVVYGSDLIVVGFFDTVDGVLVNDVARWDGSSWHALGTGTNGWVECAAVYRGDLYIGGSFTTVGGVAASNIARWDGASWYAVGSGADNKVEALAVHDGVLYAGGRFLNAGGNAASYLASWNGAAWSSVGGGTDSYVYALASHPDGLVVGGLFANAGGAAAGHVAMWNGSAWNMIGGGVDNWVESVAVHQGDVFVGGVFQVAGGVDAKALARWDGSQWFWVDGSMAATGGGATLVYDLHDAGSSLWVGGRFQAAGPVASRFIAQWQSATSDVDPAEMSSIESGALRLRLDSRNPFRDRIAITFEIDQPEQVRVEVIDAMGRQVQIVNDREFGPGIHRLEWDGRIGDASAPAGIYFLRVSTGDRSQGVRVGRLG